MNYNTYKYITGAATTTFAGELSKTLIGSININKTLTGTLTVKAGATTIAVFPIGTVPAQYWYSEAGTLIDTLSIVNSASEDVTVFYKNI